MKNLSILYAIIAIIAFTVAITNFYAGNGMNFLICGTVGIISGFLHLLFVKIA